MNYLKVGSLGIILCALILSIWSLIGVFNGDANLDLLVFGILILICGIVSYGESNKTRELPTDTKFDSIGLLPWLIVLSVLFIYFFITQGVWYSLILPILTVIYVLFSYFYSKRK